MKTFAEVCRALGCIIVFVGIVMMLSSAFSAVMPHLAIFLAWLVSNVGFAAFGALIACIGFGLFHVGEMISPWQRASSSNSSKERA